MKHVGNIAKFLDLTKPVTREQIQKALKQAKAEEKRKTLTLPKLMDQGYVVEYLRPAFLAHSIANLFGRHIQWLPTIVKNH